MKVKLLVVLLNSIFFITGCSEESDMLSPVEQNNLRIIAYQSLSDQSKETVIDWRNGKVEPGICQSSEESNIIVIDPQNQIPFARYSSDVKLFNGQKLVAVTFATTMDPLLGPIILIVEPREKKVIGTVLRM